MRLEEIRKRLDAAHDDPATFLSMAPEDMELLMEVVESFVELRDINRQQKESDTPELVTHREKVHERLNDAIHALLIAP